MINGNYIWDVGSMEPMDVSNDDLHPVVLQLLAKRGIATSEQIYRYIYPKIDLLYNPLLLKDMDKAVKRIREALVNNEKITIYGDYDVDGITSSCILVKLLKSLGGDVDYYIPSRLSEGYGLNKEAISNIHKQGTGLIITVDNGMGSCDEVEYALSMGIDVIITDHHEPQHNLPEAVAIVNPKQTECRYPFKELAGVGVALKLAQAMLETDSELINEFMEIAAIGTVADVVPLLDENRIIVKNGLDTLANTNNKGLSAMIALLNINDTLIDPRKVSYLLAPRLNAAGRVADPSIAVELLLCENESRAFELATTLENINQERQALEAKVLDMAKEAVKKEIDLDTERIIIISSPHWHPGVIGTVASKLVGIYGRPCIIITEEGNEGRGSGRSVAGFNLFEAISKLSHRLIRYGGHEQAVGLGIKVEEIKSFRKEINKLFENDIDGIEWGPKLDIDLELTQNDINLTLAEQLEVMEPFGFKNPRPVFMCKNFHIDKMKTVGEKDKHLKLNLKSRERSIDAIGFNFGFHKENLNMAPIMDLAFYLEVNRWQGYVKPQLNIKDLKVPFLQDDLLHHIEENYYRYIFFNADISELHSGSGIRDKVKRDIIVFNNKNIKSKGEYTRSLLKARIKVAVVANTPYKAWQFITLLKNSNEFNKMSVVYNDSQFQSENINDHVIIINPFMEFDTKNFDDIVFYDTPFCPEVFIKQVKDIPSDSKVHILFDQGDLRYNYMVCQQIIPSIDDLKAVYQLLSKQTSGKFICSLDIIEFRDCLKEHMGIEMRYNSLVNTFKIFQEIDIIQYKISDGILNILEYKKQEDILRLEKSNTYMNLFRLKKKVVEFYNNFFIIQSEILDNIGGK